MILDSQSLFSDAQAITASAVSTNVIDLRPVGTAKGQVLIRDIGPGNPIELLIQVVEDFDALTSLTIDIQVDDNVAFSSAKVGQSQGILLADLAAGKQSAMQYIPVHTDEAFLRLNYTVTGSNPTVGKITAGVSGGNDSNNNTY